ncbi:hypothetical protein IQ24_02965 [Paracoccus sulfuroxidans]|uniref:Uncharacterized protein n=2 Tax=Paracoccus sulfuroxidans TaxID=384678 RepID=A0A562NHD8_9RHOB|nr:hypothetical protein IQ24_02965 [Paracoccus sulfuroxidans]
MMRKTVAAPAGALAILASTMMAGADGPSNLHDLTAGDPFFYTADQDIKADDGQREMLGVGRPDRTHSGIPHLPVFMGYMNTNYTYRFVTVAEQVFTMIGEGKHGLWRVQDNGTIREYLKPGATGLKEGADPLAVENEGVVGSDYASFIPEAGWDGYRYPDQKIDDQGRLTFIDLPITHPKYQGKYQNHDPIDLPNFYCTMSENDFPYALQAMDFAFAQKAANKVGPLGKRAGLDVSENYTRVLRLSHFPDARTWVNTGVEGQDALHVDWKPVDTTQTEAEYYLVERPFFNKPYLFVAAVYDNRDNDDLSYVRPAGPYWDALGERQAGLKTEVTQAPRFHLEGGGEAAAVGTPLFGVHHPNRAAYKGGGACPLKGGDWGRYPDTSGGAGWPTNYEEVTPLCDAVLVDIKFYSNLDQQEWTDPKKYLANAATGSTDVTYKVMPGDYGTFTDPYNTAQGKVNPDAMSVPEEITLTYSSVASPVEFERPAPRSLDTAQMVPTPSTSCRPIPG